MAALDARSLLTPRDNPFPMPPLRRSGRHRQNSGWLEIGLVAAFSSERRAASVRNRWAAYVRIRRSWRGVVGAPSPRNCQMRRPAANAEATADAQLAWLGRVGPPRQRLWRRATGPGEPPRHKLVRPGPEPRQTATAANLSRSPIVLIVCPSGSLSGPPARGVGSEGLQSGFCER
jgi:hypothetical protein